VSQLTEKWYEVNLPSKLFTSPLNFGYRSKTTALVELRNSRRAQDADDTNHRNPDTDSGIDAREAMSSQAIKPEK